MLTQKQDQREKNENSTLAEQIDTSKYTNTKLVLGQDPVTFKVEGDNKFRTKKWEALMGDCAFYFDKPSI